MFEPQDSPRVFASGLGVDFTAALMAGLDQRLRGKPPEELARVEILVNSARMRRRLLSLYAERGASFVPRISPITDIVKRPELAGLPAAISPLRLRLTLARLIGKLLDTDDTLAPRSAIYDLADSLADLLAEMQEEGVRPEAVLALETEDLADHWSRSKAFLGLIAGFFDGGPGGILTPEAQQVLAVERLVRIWAAAPPSHPVLIAGSTGSRGATARLMAAVAGLPQGAVILPGVDRDMPDHVWRRLLEDRRTEALAGEDHPQFRIAKFSDELALSATGLLDWASAMAPESPARNMWLSLALRPAPVTDAWRIEAPRLPDPGVAFDRVTLLEAASPREEAVAIALRLRAAAETGQRATLVTPDRGLARQVSAALDRWRLVADDSAGMTLDRTPPGRLLAMTADLMAGEGDAATLLAVLKHPLTHSAEGRNQHLIRTRDLELRTLRGGARVPQPAALRLWAAGFADRTGDGGAADWAEWVIATILGLPRGSGRMPFADRVAMHRTLAEALARGVAGADTGKLWSGEDGQAADTTLRAVLADADAGGAINARDYRDMLVAILRDVELRNPARPHANVMIWGAMEARVQGADLVILGGLTEGSWPTGDTADPWLNRPLRAQAGLRLPDRRMGLSAHDFQQAASAAEVWLSRAVRDAEAETVPARWLNRLMNLLHGSCDASKAALEAMRARGDDWLAQAASLDLPDVSVAAARRPAPAPPVAARPNRLGVTDIEKLVRDPYAIYARKVLKLDPLDPLRPKADARLKGEVLHAIMHRFVDETRDGLPEDAEERLTAIAEEELVRAGEWPVARHLWLSTIARAAPAFIRGEVARRARATPWLLEEKGEMVLSPLAVTLSGKADRIDRQPDGRLAIYDYKSGAIPTEKVEREFNQQLRLEAVMAAHGAFQGRKMETALVAYIGLTADGKSYDVALDAEEIAKTEENLTGLLSVFMQESHGYASRRAMMSVRYASDYEHLARFGEWDEADAAQVIEVGR